MIWTVTTKIYLITKSCTCIIIMSNFHSSVCNIVSICLIYMLTYSINCYILNSTYYNYYYTVIYTRIYLTNGWWKNFATVVEAYNLAITEKDIFYTTYVKIVMFCASLWKQWALVSDWRSQ